MSAPITHHIRSLFAGAAICGVVTALIAAGGLALAGTAAASAFWMPMLIAGGLTYAGGFVGTRICGPEKPPVPKLSMLLGIGVTAFCMISLGGSGSPASQNRHKILTESKALVAQFKHAVKGTPEREPAPPKVTPAHEGHQPNGGWIGVAPGNVSPSKR